MNLATPNKDMELKNSDLVLRDSNGRERLRLDSATGDLFGRDKNGRLIFRCNVSGGNLWMGGEQSVDGDLVLFPKSVEGSIAKKLVNLASVHLDGAKGAAFIGGGGAEGSVVVRDRGARQTILLSGKDGLAVLGNKGQGGRLQLQDKSGQPSAVLDSATANLTLGRKGGGDGDLLLRDQNGTRRIHIDAGGGPVKAETSIHLNGPGGSMRLGGGQTDGDLKISDGRGTTQVKIGSGKAGGAIKVKDRDGATTVEVRGDEGDVVLHGADCAEEFQVRTLDEAEAGTVMVIIGDRQLGRSSTPCDRKVAGVVSGAGDYRPGMILGRDPSRSDRVAIALSGRVHCKVDADFGAVEVGDLLTTSPTAGHAMKVGSSEVAFGATLGKALAPLEAGRGLVPILVALQ